MGYGGYFPYPRRFGGGKPTLQVVHESLNAARGSAVDASNSSTVAWVENMAYARAITFDGYGMNERVSLQWDPDRMTSFLPRWEKIFGIAVPSAATESERRVEVKKRRKRFAEATSFHSRLVTRLSAELGSVFVAVEYIDVSNAVVHVPDPSYPFGTVADGVPWYSTVARILVLLQKPQSYSEADFYKAAGKVFPATDGLIPAWATIDWYRAPEGYPAVSVSGGPSQAGFYLDAEHNLDNSVFDSYSPVDEAGFTFWGDPRDYAAGALETFEDKNGGLLYFTQPAPGSQPVVTDGAISKRRALFFDGVDDFTQSDDPFGSFFSAGAKTVYLVYQVADDPQKGYLGTELLFGDDTGLNVALDLRVGDQSINASNDDGSLDLAKAGALHLGPHYASIRHDGTRIYLSVDGAEEVSVLSGSTAVTAVTLLLGGGTPGTGKYFRGFLGTVLIYNASHSAAARARVGAHLRAEWLL